MDFKEVYPLLLGLDSHIQAIRGGHLHLRASAGVWRSAGSSPLQPIKSLKE